MSLKLGYKQTEIGVIPEDWEVKGLLDVCAFKSGKAHEPFISELGKFVCVNSKFISTEGRVRKYATKNLSPAMVNDILMVMSDLPNGKALAKAYLADEDNVLAVNQRVCSLTSRGDYPKFLFYILNRNKYFLKFDDGVNQTHLLNKVFSRCRISIPNSVKEQKAIAEALSDVDALIDSLEALLIKKRNIKTGVMQELLTGRTRLPGFAGDWEKARLGDLLGYEQPTKYLVSSSDYVEGGQVPVLTAGKSFLLGYTDDTDGIYTNLPTIIFDDFTTATQWVDFEFKVKSSACKMLRPKNGACNPRYVFERLRALNYQTSDHKRHWISVFQSIEMLMPPLKEQEAIAAVLSDMDGEIEALEKRLAKTRDLKQGMAQELLTGRTRLV